MGEYALYGGEEIKIGTCEDMYYLRFDQRDRVKHVRGNVDVHDLETLRVLRFRFPFPDEDGVPPGSFENFDRSFAVRSVPIPEGVEHNQVQFTSHAGYVTSLPCPESTEGKAASYRVHKNGWRGDLHIKQQKFWEGKLVLVAECGGCGSAFRLETMAEASPIVEYCLKEAERFMNGKDMSEAQWWKQVAERILAGYRGVKP